MSTASGQGQVDSGTSRIGLTSVRSGSPPSLRFGQVLRSESGGGTVQWLLKRNCSMTPCQLLVCFVVLSVLPLGVASLFWWQGATLVMPFAWLEVVVAGTAMLAYARHAADRETIRLADGVLSVEHACGGRTERGEFRCDAVRVVPGDGDGSLVELSGQGRRMWVGRFVRPELREQLAQELRWALRHRSWQLAAGAA